MPRAPSARPKVDTHIGRRIRTLRVAAGLTQAQLAQGRYTAAYISALENTLVRPSLAAMTYIAARLGVGVDELLRRPPRAAGLMVDLLLASENWQAAEEAVAAQHLEELPLPERAALRRGRAEALLRLGRSAEAATEASMATSEFAAAQDGRGSAESRYLIAAATEALGDHETAAAGASNLLEDLSPADEPALFLRVCLLVAAIEQGRSRTGAAEAALRRGQDVAAQTDLTSRATALAERAGAAAAAGRDDEAARYGADALALFAARRAELAAAETLTALAMIEADARHTNSALQLLTTAALMSARLRDPELESEIQRIRQRITAAAATGAA